MGKGWEKRKDTMELLLPSDLCLTIIYLNGRAKTLAQFLAKFYFLANILSIEVGVSFIFSWSPWFFLNFREYYCRRFTSFIHFTLSLISHPFPHSLFPASAAYRTLFTCSSSLPFLHLSRSLTTTTDKPLIGHHSFPPKSTSTSCLRLGRSVSNFRLPILPNFPFSLSCW